MSNEVTIDMSSFKKFAVEMRAAEAVVLAELNKQMAATAATAASRTRSKASFSTRIPGSVRVAPRGVATYAVRAGGPAAPDAAPLNNRGMPGMFDHPVFGQNVIVSQLARPFMPTRVDVMPTERAAARRAVTNTWRKLGFH